MCLLGLGTVVISQMTNKECTGQIHSHHLRHKGRGEYIAMSFMCAGSYKISFFISTCYYTIFLCVHKTKKNVSI